MAASSSSRNLEETPTWAVAVVCFVLVVVSISIEQIIHHIGQWLAKRHKRALYESLEKIKAELMLLGFISLLLTVGQEQIAKICIPASVGDTWHPCKKKADAATKTSKATEVDSDGVEDYIGRKLLWGPLSSTDTGSARRSLAAAYGDNCGKGKVPLVSTYGIHQLHIFIFVLAVSHVLYCITTLALGRLKMRKWKVWERETKTVEYQFSHDPERFRFARETSFGRRHLTLWSRSTVLLWIVCFFRQFVRSVPKVDYLTLRHGFIMAHLAPQSAIKFDFQKYIKRSLEEDFKVVVGISPLIWFFAVLFLMSHAHGAYSYLWLPFIPLIIILLVGTKLQVIITKMGLEILDRGDVVRGVPVVQPADNHFWFKRPRLLLFLIHFVLFQNAFQLAFFAWTWFEFGLRSCFHERLEDVIIRISMGILIQILCSYVTLPLYALVTQMGSNMKSTIFNDRVAAALKNWHHTARKHVKQNRHRSGTATPVSPSRTMTPSPGFSPVHLLSRYRGKVDSRQYHSDNERSDAEGSQSPSPHKMEGLPHQQHGQWSMAEPEREIEEYPRTTDHHEIDMHSADFSFAK